MTLALGSVNEALERVPRWAIGELEIAQIGAEAQAETRANRDDGDVVGNERGHAEPADEISGPIDAAETLEDRVGAGQVINQHHRARAVRAGIKADARSLPEYAQIAGVLGVERAVAIAQAADKGAAGFLAENIAVRQPPLADRLLDDHSEAAGNAAEKSMPGIDQFVRGEPVGGHGLRRRRGRGRGGGRRAGGTPAGGGWGGTGCAATRPETSSTENAAKTETMTGAAVGRANFIRKLPRLSCLC